MAGTVTCLALPNQGGIRVFVDWNPDTHPDAPVRVERIVSGKPPVPIRAAYAPLLPATTGGPAIFHKTNCGQLFLWDFEAPPNVPVQYQATDEFGDTAISAACTLVTTSPWLKDPIRPCHNIELITDCDTACPAGNAVMWTGHDAQVYAAASAQFGVIGSRWPVNVSNIRKDAVTVLEFVTGTCAGLDRMLELTAPGTVVFLPAHDPICWKDRYLALGDHTVTPVSRDLTNQGRIHTIPAVTVAGVAGATCCVTGTTWCEMCTCADTWDEFDALNLTGIDILQGDAVVC